MVISTSPWSILPYNLMQYIFIQSKVIDIFRNSRWRPPPSWIFSLCEFGHSGVLIVWYLCSIPNLVQISVIVTEIDAYMLQTFICKLTSGFNFLVTWSSLNGLAASSHEIWCIYLYPIRSYRYFFPKLKMAAAAILDMFG